MSHPFCHPPPPRDTYFGNGPATSADMRLVGRGPVMGASATNLIHVNSEKS